MAQIADRAGISRTTLHHLENGSANVSIGVIVMVLAALGLDRDITKLAADDELGRKLMDIELELGRRRSSRDRQPAPGHASES